jgi:hypothetical protein
MFSKFYTVMIIVSLVVLTAAVALQVLEMQRYNLFNKFMSKSSSDVVVATPEKKAAKPANAAPAADAKTEEPAKPAPAAETKPAAPAETKTEAPAADAAK